MSCFVGLFAQALDKYKDPKYKDLCYTSDLFSFIGTVMLRIYGPSFVAGRVPSGTDGHA